MIKMQKSLTNQKIEFFDWFSVISQRKHDCSLCHTPKIISIFAISDFNLVQFIFHIFGQTATAACCLIH